MMKKRPAVSIEPSGLRVEFQGSKGPTHLVIPILFHKGEHKDICLRIHPSSGISLGNSVVTGDALQEIFCRQHSISVGGSFFAEASYSYSFGSEKGGYEVVWLPDFRGVLFRLDRYEVKREPVGLQFAFPIINYDPDTDARDFAEISLETKGEVIETHRVPRVVHPNAGRIFLLSDFSPAEFHARGFDTLLASQIAGLRRTYVTVTDLKFFTDELPSPQSYDGIHLFTDLSDSIAIYDYELIESCDGFGLKFLYIDTCNSVEVVSRFRRTDIGALIAATSSLSCRYANAFHNLFYEELGKGASISQAFHRASQQAAVLWATDPSTLSKRYDPMFLDLRSDASFSARIVHNEEAA